MSDESGLFGPILARGFVGEAVSDLAFARAMARAEAALAAVQAEAGLVPADHAAAIDAVCRGSLPNPTALGELAAATGTPVVPLLEALRARLPADMWPSLHRGATSQDIVDTAAMLTAAGAVRVIAADLEHAAVVARRLAREHATTVMPGRTLLQHARPTSFGAKAAGWLAGLEAAIGALADVRDGRLAVQLGGPVGTLEAFGSEPEAIVTAFAERLELCAPAEPWHAERSRIVALAAALAIASSTVAKVALDLVLLAQTEVGEVGDDLPDRGASSSMPHKRNPVASILARAAAMRAAGLTADVVVAASSGEHERAAGAWHAEWMPLRELLISTGSAASWLRDALDHLAVDEGRMRKNLQISGAMEDIEGAVRAASRLAERAAARTPVTAARATKVHHVVDGPAGAEVLVLSGSLGSTLAMWDPVVDALAARFRVVRWDLRGHGGSPTPPGPYTIDDIGADLLDLLDRIGAPRAHLVGTSLGGMAGLLVAARAPERVDRMVVIGSSARLGPASGWVDRARMVLRDGTGPVAEVVTPRWVSATFAGAHPDALDGYRAMFAAADPAGYAGCCIAIAGMDLTDQLGAIKAPTLVIVGSDDPATPVEHGRAIADALPDARLEIVAGAAHLPSLEHPDRIAQLILDHLR
jgi:3-carboxy-cis,cis-muconate cycloisomerase